jgi:hypothetical protein
MMLRLVPEIADPALIHERGKFKRRVTVLFRNPESGAIMYRRHLPGHTVELSPHEAARLLLAAVQSVPDIPANSVVSRCPDVLL